MRNKQHNIKKKKLVSSLSIHEKQYFVAINLLGE